MTYANELGPISLLDFILTTFAKFPPSGDVEPLLLTYPPAPVAPATFAKLVAHGYLRAEFGGPATFAQLDYRVTRKTLELAAVRRARMTREKKG
jgi:hypothetical protein